MNLDQNCATVSSQADGGCGNGELELENGTPDAKHSTGFVYHLYLWFSAYARYQYVGGVAQWVERWSLTGELCPSAP